MSCLVCQVRFPGRMNLGIFLLLILIEIDAPSVYRKDSLFLNRRCTRYCFRTENSKNSRIPLTFFELHDF